MHRFHCRRVDLDVFHSLQPTKPRKPVISLHSGRLDCRLLLAGKNGVQFFPYMLSLGETVF